MGKRLRLLPVLVVAAALMLALRVGVLWQDTGAAFAQTTPAAPATPPAQGGQGAKPVTGAPATGQAATPAAKGATERPAEEDVTNFSPGEIEVLQGLAARRAAIEDRESDAARRDALLQAAEKRIEAKLDELRKMQASVESAIRRYDEQEEARKKSLVKIFETMKAKDAARIFEQMDMPVLIEIVERMREARTAPILAELPPVRAKQITAELAKRRQPTRGG